MAPIPCAWNVGNTDEAVVEVSVMSMPSVPRLSVTSTGAGRRTLLEVSIDAPRDGGMSEAWAVRVRGHLLSETGPAQEIVAVVPGSVLATAVTGLPTPEVAARHPNVPGAEACGFTLLVDTLGLPQRFEFRLRAALSDGSRVKVAAISGERRALTTAYAPRLQPLLVTSLGRMGTTLLMRMLAAHPAVVVYDRPPYEARGGKYWLHVLKTLAAPTDASKRVGAPMEFHLEPLAAGGNPFYSAAFAAWPEVEAWSGSTYVTDLAAFCQRSIDGWYLATAAAQGQASDAARLLRREALPRCLSAADARALPGGDGSCFWCGTSGTWSPRCRPTTRARDSATSDGRRPRAKLAGWPSCAEESSPCATPGGTRGEASEPGPLRRPGARPGGDAAPATEPPSGWTPRRRR